MDPRTASGKSGAGVARTPSPSAPQPSLGVLLFIPYRHLESRILDAVTAAGFPITLTQARLLQRIDPAGSRLSRLAAAAQISKQTAGFLVDQLAATGYVERVADPSDGRARIVRFTASGHRLVAVAVAEQTRIETEWIRHLGEPSATGLREALGRLREITDPFG